MPRRTKDQSNKRNATRRENSIRNRKAVFCLKHLKITKPEIYNEAGGTLRTRQSNLSNKT